MLNPCLEDWTLAEESGKDINLHRRASRDQGGGRSHGEVEEQHIKGRGKFSSTSEVEVYCQGKERDCLVSHCQHRHSNAEIN